MKRYPRVPRQMFYRELQEQLEEFRNRRLNWIWRRRHQRERGHLSLRYALKRNRPRPKHVILRRRMAVVWGLRRWRRNPIGRVIDRLERMGMT